MRFIAPNQLGQFHFGLVQIVICLFQMGPIEASEPEPGFTLFLKTATRNFLIHFTRILKAIELGISVFVAY